MSAHDFHPGRLVMVDIPGRTLDADTAAFLRQHRIRAVCLFRKNLGSEQEVRRLTHDLHQVLGPQALIGLDQEGGSVVRSTFLPQPPSAMALGAAADAGLAEIVGAAVARGLRSLGINWNFAPVLDVNNNPANPVIAERSFGDDPDEVIRLAGAWMRGALREGVACCAKHFPGHGDTHVDSHLALPSVNKSRAELDALELRPFKALKDLAPSMMTAHIVYPQLDADHPATLSPRLLQGLLRREWGYEGVVITDALMMKAIAERYGHGRAAVLAVAAGADMVLAQGSRQEQHDTIAALASALQDGQLTAAQGVRAMARIDRLAHRYPARPRPYPLAQREQDDTLMRQAWAASLTRLRDPTPPSRAQPLRVLVQSDVPTDEVSEAGPSSQQALALFERFSQVDSVVLDDITHLDWNALPRDGRLTVLVSTRRERYGNCARAWHPDLHLVLWNPFQALDVDAPAVLSWGYAEGALSALKRWLEGRWSAEGRPLASLSAAA
jgi:beta-N-acetylhexosaminidase